MLSVHCTGYLRQRNTPQLCEIDKKCQIEFEEKVSWQFLPLAQAQVSLLE